MSNELFKRILSSIILIPIALFFIIKGSFLFYSFILICFIITVYEWQMMSKNKPYNFIGFIFLIISFFTIYKLRIDPEEGYWFFLSITIICVSTDIGGYVFGKIFKGPKLTKFSPNKTYAGMIGGFLFSLIFMTIFTNNLLGEELSINWLIFIIMVSCTSQLGDIIISYFKRLSKIKDTGKIIPGHGGLLDRVDGMIFAFPFSYIVFLTDLI
ncbi:phosphatidate cytidylyltransferase [Candidatus Pelagibacter sp.]|nr:phosphatidate cytidylyltransferase [Candidatus Pelagibacter sp.]